MAQPQTPYQKPEDPFAVGNMGQMYYQPIGDDQIQQALSSASPSFWQSLAPALGLGLGIAGAAVAGGGKGAAIPAALLGGGLGLAMSGSQNGRNRRALEAQLRSQQAGVNANNQMFLSNRDAWLGNAADAEHMTGADTASDLHHLPSHGNYSDIQTLRDIMENYQTNVLAPNEKMIESWAAQTQVQPEIMQRGFQQTGNLPHLNQPQPAQPQQPPPQYQAPPGIAKPGIVDSWAPPQQTQPVDPNAMAGYAQHQNVQPTDYSFLRAPGNERFRIPINDLVAAQKAAQAQARLPYENRKDAEDARLNAQRSSPNPTSAWVQSDITRNNAGGDQARANAQATRTKLPYEVGQLKGNIKKTEEANTAAGFKNAGDKAMEKAYQEGRLTPEEHAAYQQRGNTTSEFPVTPLRPGLKYGETVVPLIDPRTGATVTSGGKPVYYNTKDKRRLNDSDYETKLNYGKPKASNKNAATDAAKAKFIEALTKGKK